MGVRGGKGWFLARIQMWERIKMEKEGEWNGESLLGTLRCNDFRG
jgi:hypothetical protein